LLNEHVLDYNCINSQTRIILAKIFSSFPFLPRLFIALILQSPTRKFTALKIRVKPRHDIKDINYLLNISSPTEKLFADYAYDAEFVHEKCFGIKVQTIIKPKKNVKRGFYRRKQMKNYSEKIYHWLSLIESGFGSLKRKYGSSVSGKSWKSVNSEIYCKAISHNLNLTPS